MAVNSDQVENPTMVHYCADHGQIFLLPVLRALHDQG
jgi:hypothetical protein